MNRRTKPQKRITSTYLEALRPGRDNGEFVIDRGTRGQGALVLRVTDTAKPLYFRYFHDGARRFELVGYFDSRGATHWNASKGTHRGGVLTLTAARQGFAELSRLATVTGDLKAHFAAEAAIEQAARRKAEIEARAGTFEELLDTYVAALEAQGKPSAREARGSFDRNVRRSFAHLLKDKANEITADDIQTILARMVKRGVRRQVNILRSYLRAAFAYAASAHDYDPRRLAKDGKAFRLAGNPVDVVPRIAEFDQIGERTLSANELRSYVNKLDSVPNPIVRAFLKLHLWTGAQRPQQMLRAGWDDYDLHAGLLTIVDTKGRASRREHIVPLLAEALEQIELVRMVIGRRPRNANRDGGQATSFAWPFATHERGPLRIETVAHAVAEISQSLQRETRMAEGFTLRDLRRTVETALAARGIPKEVRAQLLSHGRGDKIDRTYNKHGYIEEKRRALEAWRAFVLEALNTQSATNVVPMQPRRQAARRSV